MAAKQPANRPQNSQQWFIDKLQAARKQFKAPAWDLVTPTLFGCEAYYQSMGNPNTNDIGMYDDALVLLWKGGFLAVNANLDPTTRKPGHGNAEAKGRATIHYGYFKDAYAVGKHKTIYPALRQVGTLTIRRDADTQIGPEKLLTVDGEKFYLEVGDWQACNIHPGGVTSTSSEGCQTIPRGAMWDLFISTAVNALKLSGNKYFDYTKARVRG